MALPDSPDSYFQEIGRAGRDGEPGRALLLWRPEDEAIQRFFTGGAPDLVEIRDLAAALRAGPVTKTQLKERTGLGPRKLCQLLGLLEQENAAVPSSANRLTVPLAALLPAAAAEAAVAESGRQQIVQRSRTDMMRAFAETRSCRTQTLLMYFGEQMKKPCGHCDNCLDATVAEPLPEAASGPFPVHSNVWHGEWGVGMVMGYEQEKMTVLFDDVGYKTLSVPVVQEHGLLVAEKR